MCEGINRYDKLRLILVEASERIVALLEFSFDITESDIGRYVAHGLPLDPATDCRFALCVTDERQNRGIGSLLLPFAVGIACRFGRRRMILWGGVHEENRGALRYYTKNGFQEAGRFVNQDGVASIDMYVLLR